MRGLIEEMKQVIPFSFLPPKVVVALSKRMLGLTTVFSKHFDSLQEDLVQADYTYSAQEYYGIALAVAMANSFFSGFLFSIVAIAIKIPLLFVLVGVIVIGLASFGTILIYPKIVARRKGRAYEKNLIPAVRQLLIQLRSGVTLFDAMASVADDYGEVSKEFKKIVQKINAGTPEVDALSDASRSVPSRSFQKVLWQVANAIKVGSDVSDALGTILDDITTEQIDKIHSYGQELSPWTMMYMMAAVIVPSLGITMLIVITSFLNISIPKLFLVFVIVGIIGFQLFFMNFVGSRRPFT
ncbi:type II secretion system F family protein [Candidatus Micrarchaeota archaeon]|nr:type II secretion system F family protein [Candidatus Micrarchaeota archaeon]